MQHGHGKQEYYRAKGAAKRGRQKVLLRELSSRPKMLRERSFVIVTTEREVWEPILSKVCPSWLPAQQSLLPTQQSLLLAQHSLLLNNLCCLLNNPCCSLNNLCCSTIFAVRSTIFAAQQSLPFAQQSLPLAQQSLLLAQQSLLLNNLCCANLCCAALHIFCTGCSNAPSAATKLQFCLLLSHP